MMEMRQLKTVIPCLAIPILGKKKLNCMESDDFNYYFCSFSGDSMFQLNPEQQSAVANIINAKNYPLPYILIGPPGESIELTMGFLLFSIAYLFPFFCVQKTKERVKHERWLLPLSKSFS